MGDSGPLEWSSSHQIISQRGPRPSSTDDGGSVLQEHHERMNNTLAGEPLIQSPDSADSSSFTAALYSYFNFAAPYLPILLEDAFWQDYHADRCSQALVYAVACRGVPFTAAVNRWDLQQRFAERFREAFLEARSAASSDGTVRLDDLEALALMVDFEYEDTATQPLHASLGRLFLTHESLVLMTLQSRICDRGPAGSESSETLARASERRVLLYWHVYGLDAFHCLDRKQISYIPDDHAASSEVVPQNEAKGYFDAILALAIIARKTIRTLCSTAAKSRGVEPHDVHSLYDQLRHWRNNSCPERLRRHDDGTGKLANRDLGASAGESASNKHTQLHRAVLWALEANCLMQIESCVSQYGIHDSSSLEAEAAAVRVEFESVRALNDMVAACRWMGEHEIYNREDKSHSLIDLAPTALRNICAGMCFWACRRGIELYRRNPPISLHISSKRDRISGEHAGIDIEKRHVNTYVETARLLRDAVATATSHRDTAQILERLHKQLALLKTELGDTQIVHE